MKPKLYLTRLLPQGAMERLHSFFELDYNCEDRVLDKEEIIAKVPHYDALLCLLTDSIDQRVIDANPKLKVISNYAVGYNNIDVAYATQQEIPVCITPGVLTESSADLAWALLMATARRLPESDAYTRQGKFKGWGPELFLGADVYGQTLGIVGMGRIGAAVARRAQGFNMRILYTANSDKHEVENKYNARRVSLEELLHESDFVSLHCPLNEETTHLIGKHELSLMKKSAYLINTARGPVVDEKALITALEEEKIAGAGLDVYEEEPKVPQELLALPQVVALPHIASATHSTRTQMGVMAAENAIAIFQGTAPHAIVNPQVLTKKDRG